MADRKPVDPLDDLEALLRREMAVNPSAGFLPRVRDRVRSESPARWHWRVMVAAPVAVFVGIAAVSVWPLRISQTTPPSASEAPAMPIAAPIALVRVPPADLSEPARPVLSAVRGVVGQNDELSLPVVVVDTGQQAALGMLLRMVRDGKLTEESFAKTTPQSLQPIEAGVPAIEVQPVAVSPFPGGGVSRP